ncbi:MAG: sugar phosphate isomerase/epimerase, partial [Phycisphaeraceae bacterium]|nr:sugar phosphate isomerase/epimerase [Phycisphaeraceae bacterium]
MAGVFGPLAVQSYCFRSIKENVQVADAVRKIGLDRIEICGVHCNFDQPDTFESVIGAYRDAGVEIISLGVERLSGDRDRDRTRFEFAKQAGCGHMSINFDPAEFSAAHRVAAELAEEYDLKLGIHNHGGYHWLGSRQMLAHAFSLVGDRIGLCLDTAWALQAGEKPEKMVELFGPRLFAMHLKDFTFKPDG